MNSAVAVLVLATLCGNSISDAADASCTDSPKSATQILRRKLFCDYDVNVRPVKSHTNTTDVVFTLILHSMVFREGTNTLDVRSWFGLEWKDEHLTWDRAIYGGLRKLDISSSKIWVPDIVMYSTTAMHGAPLQMSETKCDLKFDGQVTCFSQTTHAAHCNADISRWPFDSHNCTMLFGSFSNRRDTVNMSFRETGVDIDAFNPSRDWELLDKNVFLYIADEHPSAVVSFLLKRHSGGHAATVFIPSLVLAILTLSVFWIEPCAVERLCLGCLNIVCHCLYLQYLSVNLPANGDKYPIILIFFRDSLLLVGASLFISLLVRRLDAATSAPPAWITTITDAVVATMPGQILMGGEINRKAVAGYEDVTGLIETTRQDQRWHLIAVLLDRIFFLIFLLTFIVLLCAFVP